MMKLQAVQIGTMSARWYCLSSADANVKKAIANADDFVLKWQGEKRGTKLDSRDL